ITAGTIAAVQDGRRGHYASMALDIVGVAASMTSLGSGVRATRLAALGEGPVLLRNAAEAGWLISEGARAGRLAQNVSTFSALIGSLSFGISAFFGGRLPGDGSAIDGLSLVSYRMSC